MKKRPPLPTNQVNRLIDDLGQVWRRIYMLVLEPQARHDLGSRGIWILRYIATGEVYPSDLAAILVTSPSLVSAEINRLIAAKMVTRESAAHDGRRSRLALTTKAHELLAESQRVFERFLNPAFEKFSERERKTFFSLLESLSQTDLAEPAAPKDERRRLRQLEAENRRLRQIVADMDINPGNKRR